jgi:hypothetical protein
MKVIKAIHDDLFFSLNNQIFYYIYDSFKRLKAIYQMLGNDVCEVGSDR